MMKDFAWMWLKVVSTFLLLIVGGIAGIAAVIGYVFILPAYLTGLFVEGSGWTTVGIAGWVIVHALLGISGGIAWDEVKNGPY